MRRRYDELATIAFGFLPIMWGGNIPSCSPLMISRYFHAGPYWLASSLHCVTDDDQSSVGSGVLPIPETDRSQMAPAAN
jgi:hypothetical protein